MFSFAYISLDVGTGALILFALVQTTMIVWGLVRGERPGPLQWIGLAVALGGLVYLVSPGLSAPSPLGSAMMATAGVAWGVYSLRGRGAMDPIVSTTDNFVRSVPLVLITAVVFFGRIDFSADGVAFAAVSGSLASGVGYVIWYVALRGLTTTRAAAVQLTVPAIAAAGGVGLLSESVSLRLVVFRRSHPRRRGPHFDGARKTSTQPRTTVETEGIWRRLARLSFFSTSLSCLCYNLLLALNSFDPP